MAIRTITVDNISYPIANDKVTQVEIAPNASTSSTTSFPMIFSPANASVTTNVTDEVQKSRNLRFSPSPAVLVITGTSENNSGRFQIQDENNKAYAFLSKYYQGTTSTIGLTVLSLGNSTGSGTASNAQGQIQIYGTGTKPNIIKSGAGSSADRDNIIPDVSGYFAIGVTTGVGNSTTPVYMDSTGELKACSLTDSDTKVTQTATSTSGYYPVLSKGTTSTSTVTDTSAFTSTIRMNPAVGQIVLNGSANTSTEQASAFKLAAAGNTNSVGVFMKDTEGTASTVGITRLNIGNNIASGTANNAKGLLKIYNSTNRGNVIASNASSTDKDNLLPNVSGFLAVGVTTGVGGVSTPIYMDSNGELKDVTLKSASQNLLNSLDEATSTVGTTTYVITNGGSASYTTNFYKRPISSVVSSANVKAALGTTTTTANKVLSDTGAWVALSDEKVDQNVTTSSATYPILLGATSGATETYNGEVRFRPKTYINTSSGAIFTNGDSTSSGFTLQTGDGSKIIGYLRYQTVGTTTATGVCGIQMGNNTANGTAGNAKGTLWMYGTGTGYHTIETANTGSTNYTFTIPNITGTAVVTAGAQTIDGAKTFATTVYFANGTTYYVGSTGNAKVNTLTSAGAATFSSTSTHTGAATFNNKIIGKSGAVSAGNYTTTVPTTAGTTGQIMFVLSS